MQRLSMENVGANSMWIFKVGEKNLKSCHYQWEKFRKIKPAKCQDLQEIDGVGQG